MKKEVIELDPSQQQLVERATERALKHRGITLSLKFRQRDIDAWKSAAEASKESLTDWMERVLNKAEKTERSR